MPSIAESAGTEAERPELQAVLRSELFARSPALAHLLSYLCEKMFAGESGQIKEYSIAVDVFGRSVSFDQDSDSIVRVQANRLRKRLAEYYSGEGAAHHIQITIPVGQYVPVFEERAALQPVTPAAQPASAVQAALPPGAEVQGARSRRWWTWVALAGIAALLIFGLWVFTARRRAKVQPVAHPLHRPQVTAESTIGPPVGDEIRILAGADRGYVDRAGKSWNPDAYFDGGTPLRSPAQHIWRTQDPGIYRTSRQGDFSYNIPLKPGIYELRLHFAETFYGPEDVGGGGEGSRILNVAANGRPLLSDFDVLADAGGSRTADIKVFTDISPADDGQLHLSFSSAHGGKGMLSAMEILPGSPGRMRPVRIVTRDVPYYSNDSHWWGPDAYFKGGRLSASEEPAAGTDDPELYETERWGYFSYAIPVAPGRYSLTLHFIERRLNAANRESYAGSSSDSIRESGGRQFNVFCNGKAILRNLNLVKEVGENRPLVRKIAGLEPNAQGKLLLEFVPVRYYATVTAIEVEPQ